MRDKYFIKWKKLLLVKTILNTLIKNIYDERNTGTTPTRS